MSAPTKRGRRSRARIVDAAAKLFHEQGVSSTSVDAVLRASATGKSQFYHYFNSKNQLVVEVIHQQLEWLEKTFQLEQLDSWEGIERWFGALVELMRHDGCVGGCPLGSMAAEVADTSPELREELHKAMTRIRAHLERGLSAMKREHRLAPEADPRAMALFTVAAVQGGCLLAKTSKRSHDLEAVCDRTLGYLKSFARQP